MAYRTSLSARCDGSQSSEPDKNAYDSFASDWTDSDVNQSRKVEKPTRAALSMTDGWTDERTDRRGPGSSGKSTYRVTRVSSIDDRRKVGEAFITNRKHFSLSSSRIYEFSTWFFVISISSKRNLNDRKKNESSFTIRYIFITENIVLYIIFFITLFYCIFELDVVCL